VRNGYQFVTHFDVEEGGKMPFFDSPVENIDIQSLIIWWPMRQRRKEKMN